MSTINIYPLDPRCGIEVGPRWEPSPAIIPAVDAIWAEEKKKRRERLTDGLLYTLADFRPDLLTIQPSEYRYALARRRAADAAPHLIAAGLTIRMLAVTGVLICSDGLVLGLRSANVASDADAWEPAPAGGLAQPDPHAQVMEELGEELGLAASDIVSSEVCGLVEDTASGVLDIVYRLRTPLNGHAIKAAHKRRATDEYADLAIVRVPDVPNFLEREAVRLLPTLRPMLSMAWIIPG